MNKYEVFIGCTYSENYRVEAETHEDAQRIVEEQNV